ncbi:hypothetical protein VTL71DRAFT_1123 [Oculimacula yallundae]|uniref:Uncharacterized protein n=1 Tax=Oculimacula yallundae TaxID=86028 RepID=A0ABR4D1Z0_9HELO
MLQLVWCGRTDQKTTSLTWPGQAKRKETKREGRHCGGGTQHTHTHTQPEARPGVGQIPISRKAHPIHPVCQSSPVQPSPSIIHRRLFTTKRSKAKCELCCAVLPYPVVACKAKQSKWRKGREGCGCGWMEDSVR